MLARIASPGNFLRLRNKPSRSGIPGKALVALSAWLLLGVLSANAAANDGTIESDAIRHNFYEVSPERNESFTLELRAFRFDLTGATVRVVPGGGEAQYFPMDWNREDGEFDYWRVTIPGIDREFAYYHFQVFDGGAYGTLARSGYWGGDPPGGDFLLNLTALGQYPLGATVDGDDTVFRVWAPNAEVAQLILDPDAATPTYLPMTEVEGFWQVRAEDIGAGHAYKFRFLRDGEWLVRNDPRAKQVTSSVGVSIVVDDDAFVWTDQDWNPPTLAEAVINEVHVGTFSGRGDGAVGHPATFRDLVDHHVTDLVDSGVNVIQLMPIHEFRGDLSWGYNPIFLFAPESVYGDVEDFKYLVNKCHEAGIAVYLDVVLNHFDEPDLPGNLLDFDGPEDIYLYDRGRWERDTGFGPRPDFGRIEVRDFLIDSVRYFIEECHIDGFRYDHTALIKINSDGWKLLRELTAMRDAIAPDVVLTAEQWPNDQAIIQPVKWGGAGIDAQWSDIYHDNMREVLNLLAYGDPNMYGVADALNHFGFPATGMINFIESHDEARESPQFAREGRVVQVADQINPHSEFGQSRGKLFYGILMGAGAVPLILQGQEFATEIGYGDSAANKIPWEYKDTYDGFYRACRDLTWLKRRSPALRADAAQNVYQINDVNNVIAWSREWGGEHLVFVANFSNTDYSGYWVGLPVGGEWQEIINTNAIRYDSDGNYQNPVPFDAFNGPSNGMPFSHPIELPKRGMVVLGQRDYNLTPNFYPGPEITDFIIAPKGEAAMSLLWQGRANIEYLLESSAHLGGWSPVTTVTPSADGELRHDFSPGPDRGFYRLQVFNGE